MNLENIMLNEIKSVTKDHILYDFIYINVLNRQIYGDGKRIS